MKKLEFGELLGDLEELSFISENDQSSNASIRAAAANPTAMFIPATRKPKRQPAKHGPRRGHYAARVAKIVKRLQVIHPDLSEAPLTDYVRRSFIADISDACYFAEAACHIDWVLSGSIPRDGYIPPKVSRTV